MITTRDSTLDFLEVALHALEEAYATDELVRYAIRERKDFCEHFLREIDASDATAKEKRKERLREYLFFIQASALDAKMII